MYLIVDWHSIGNLETELFQHPQYVTSVAETANFWKSIAHRYKGVATMAVYEIFNEPTLYTFWTLILSMICIINEVYVLFFLSSPTQGAPANMVHRRDPLSPDGIIWCLHSRARHPHPLRVDRVDRRKLARLHLSSRVLPETAPRSDDGSKGRT